MDGYRLTQIEVRILGVLVEKQALTPDIYPMTLNGLIGACNQLTSREPVMQLTDQDLLAALDNLLIQKLIAERTPTGSRVTKYEHRLNYEWRLDGACLAVLTLLMLRGPQTSAEIRARSGRIYGFSSTEEVETALNTLSDKYPPMVVKLARQPGAREARWAHLLCGEPQQIVEECREIDVGLAGRVAALEAQVEALKTRLADIESQLEE